MPDDKPILPETHEPPLTAGSCILAQPACATIVQNALLHFEAERYYLRAWCIMPNHVHVVVTLMPEPSLENILHSWKSYTANQLNRLRGVKGEVWQRESFTHVIRRSIYLEAIIFYTEENPVVAQLCSSARDWPFSSAGMQFKPSPLARFLEPGDTPFVELQYRGRLPQLYKPGCTCFITFRLADAVERKM